jgi:hypothetical protein
MADSDKDILITPNVGVATNHPEIKFVGKDNSPMYLRVLDDNALSFEGTEGQVFSMSPTMSSGDIFSVSDISGVQSMAVNADGTIKIIPSGTNPSSNLYLGDLRHCFVYARGTGNNNAANSLVYLNGKKIVDSATRGLMLTIINQTDLSVVSSTNYDTYTGSTTNTNNLATAIGNMTDQQIGILVSEDAWEPNSSNGTNLWAAAKLVGLTKLGHYDGGDGSVRRPYAAIFMGSGDDANAANKFVIERMADADGDAPMASISAILVSDGVHASISGAQNQNALWSSDSNHEAPALIVDEDKQVGIGTATPDSTLHLTSGAGYLKFETSGSVGSIKSDFNLDLYADDTDGNSDSYQNIRFFTAGANERMRITHAGFVGIGTDSPDGILDVSSASTINAYYTKTATPCTFHTQVQTSAVIMGTTTNHNLQFKANGGVRMTLQPGGNVGINDTTPSYKLDVNGTGRFTGALTGNATVVSDGAGDGVVTLGETDGVFIQEFVVADGSTPTDALYSNVNQKMAATITRGNRVTTSGSGTNSSTVLTSTTSKYYLFNVVMDNISGSNVADTFQSFDVTIYIGDDTYNTSRRKTLHCMHDGSTSNLFFSAANNIQNVASQTLDYIDIGVEYATGDATITGVASDNIAVARFYITLPRTDNLGTDRFGATHLNWSWEFTGLRDEATNA